MILVFAMGSFTNVNANNKKVENVDPACTQAAWDYGTAFGGGNHQREYKITKCYYATH